MMTEALAYGITSLPLTTLLSGGSDPSYSSTEYFVRFYIDHFRFILQVLGLHLSHSRAHAPARPHL